jgi:hypothetical protein
MTETRLDRFGVVEIVRSHLQMTTPPAKDRNMRTLKLLFTVQLALTIALVVYVHELGRRESNRMEDVKTTLRNLSTRGLNGNREVNARLDGFGTALGHFHNETNARLDGLGTALGRFHNETNARFESLGTALGPFHNETNARLDGLGTALGRFHNETNARFESLGTALGRFQGNTTNSLNALPSTLGRMLLDVSPKVVVGREGSLHAYTAERIVLQPFDNDVSVLNGTSGNAFSDISRKTILPCPGPAPGTAVLLIAGQSQAANSGQGHQDGGSGVFNLNIYDGKCYQASDPLIGTSGNGANFATRLGKLLVSSGSYRNVVLIPVAIGGASLRQWIPEGGFHRRLLVAIERARQAGLKITHFLWQQGEADIVISNGALYHHMFEDMFISLRQHGMAAPIFVAETSYCGLRNDEVTSAQAGLVSAQRGIYAGPATDDLGDELRRDKCHFNDRGLDQMAAMWAKSLHSHP